VDEPFDFSRLDMGFAIRSHGLAVKADIEAQASFHGGLDHGLTVIVHVCCRACAGPNHFSQAQARAMLDQLGGQMFFAGENHLEQPGMEIGIIGLVAHQGHRDMAMGIGHGGPEDLALAGIAVKAGASLFGEHLPGDLFIGSGIEDLAIRNSDKGIGQGKNLSIGHWGDQLDICEKHGGLHGCLLDYSGSARSQLAM